MRPKVKLSLLNWIRKTDLVGSGHYGISVDDLLSGIPKEKKSEQAENLNSEYLSKDRYPQKELVKKSTGDGYF